MLGAYIFIIVISSSWIDLWINNDVSSPNGQNGHHKKYLQTVNAGKGVEKREPSCTVGGNVN